MSSFVKSALLGLILVDLVALNFGFIKLLTQPKANAPKSEIVLSPTLAPKPTAVLSPTITPAPEKTVVQKTPVSKVKTVSYIPVPGSGSVLNTQWTDIPGTEFSINTDDYPNIADTRLEANMKLLNGNGKAYLRLFDTTVGIEVWGSQIETSNQNFTFITSTEIYIRPGNHLYKIQAKSLTADTTVLNSARIKIVSEN